MRPAIQHFCSGCRRPVPAGEPYPFRCSAAGADDDTDHVLTRVLDPAALPAVGPLKHDFLAAETNPFVKYRKLLASYHAALAGGLGDAEFVALVRRLDDAVAAVDGQGFRVTPFRPRRVLAHELGMPRLWVKDETANVAGSHKARHLMGLAIWLEVQRALGTAGEPRPLAIASCGNAALAAAVVAVAAARPLAVFVPAHADPAVVGRLERLGATLTRCPRQPGAGGDPSYRRFREAVAAGALPFTCQGPENGLVLEGGETLAFEMISVLIEHAVELDVLAVQVGGGALATAVARGFEEARVLGLVRRLPRLVTVQSEGAAPLARAYDLVAERLVAAAGGDPPRGRRARAEWILESVPAAAVEEALRYAAAHRQAFMWPWEQEPRSVATGILDDETYDWLALVRAMLVTGGVPLVVSERVLKEANTLARRFAGIAVDATGSAGLAGLLALAAAGGTAGAEDLCVLSTGVSR
ncbi:MAG: pyridoxal-phosphate dependent enzyme [Acidobacteriota bacterium]|nr:pyridoxal-phosphate dependent enzyme [Acidobacteriota bacterium]